MDDFRIEAKTRAQLAGEYNVNIRTFLKWIRDAKIDIPCGLISPKKVEEIYSKIGLPSHKNPDS